MNRELGVPGVGLEPGDHVCGFNFGDDERDSILLENPHHLTADELLAGHP